MRKIILLVLFVMVAMQVQSAVIKGKVLDSKTSEPLIGASLQVYGTTTVSITDVDGNFEIAGLKKGKYKLVVSYLSYVTKVEEVEVEGVAEYNVLLEPDTEQLQELVVTAKSRNNTTLAMVSQQKNSPVVQSGISAQQITRSQDKDASEVIRRIPGISIIDEKFVMVRGLSQRYNNVWINNGAVPSSEADSRAFSFDIIPSSQLDNMIVVKSPAPQYPSDFSGGFIMINTKDVPNNNMLNISVGGSINDQTHLKSFLSGKGSPTDFLGFDSGLRSIKGGINSKLNEIAGNGIDLKNNGFNNNWSVGNSKPIADMSLNFNIAHRWIGEAGQTFSMMGAANYSNSYKTYLNMENSLFGTYDQANGKSSYLRHSKDNQYNKNVRVGAMLNFTYVTSSGNSRYEFKNIFNQLGKDRYTQRVGVSAQSDNEESAEYYYTSRLTYNTQLTGKHSVGSNNIDWSVGMAYANRNMPDRKRYLINDALSAGELGLTNANDINREWSRLNEYIYSANANYDRQFKFGNFKPQVKAGVYGEYRNRDYNTRMFIYNYNAVSNNLPRGFRYMSIPDELMRDEYYGVQGFYLLEKVKWSNNYDGNNKLAAGYVSASMAFGKLNVFAGVRYEYSQMELVSNTKDYEKSPKSDFFTYKDFFPSINTTYKINDRHQARLSYGRTTNRPEFREVSPSVFYDFDLVSNVQGNFSLKSAYVNNVDLGYEFYPSAGELVSVSLFYKNFTNPIEWTYTVNGGTDLTYSYMNAKGADNYGVEVDIRKNLDFMGLRNFSWNFNGAYINSKVKFDSNSSNSNRPMQGQSPYIVNSGIFYTNSSAGLNVAVLYNRIGKRIVGVGRSLGTAGDEAKVPDSYEMPRNSIDLSIAKKFGKHVEVKASVRDLLAEKVSFKQFAETTGGTVEQITRQYKPGRNFGMNICYNF